MTKVSIIMPVYNVEKYLRECLDSVVNQTLQDIEIICIDDGSTDNSGTILDEYAKKDARIKVIHKENEGQGATRNLGIDIAQGEYIGFVDPDDKINNEMYQKMYEQAKELNSEIVLSKYTRYYEDIDKLTKPNCYYKAISPIEKASVKMPEGKNIDKEIINQFLIVSTCYSWSRLYLSSFIKNNKIYFSKERAYQDCIFVIKSHILAQNISFINKAFYFYRVRKTSTIRSREERVFNYIQTAQDIEDFLIENQLLDKFRDNLTHFYIDGTNIIYNSIKSNKNKKYLLNEMKKHVSKENYKILYKYVKYSKILSFLKNIFSIKDTKNKKNKVITIFGHKINTKDIYSIKDAKNKKSKILTIIGHEINTKDVKSFIQNIFSVKNVKRKNGTKHKVLTILGIKLKFRKK